MIDVALIGCGRWGRRLLAALAAHPQIRVRAVVDREARALEVAAATAPDAALHTNLDAALQGSSGAVLAAVFVATPPSAHAGHAHTVLSAGLDVFVEKPLATNAHDAQLLCEAVEQAGRIGMVGHILRFHPAVTQFVAAVHAGKIGKPRELIVRRHTQSRSPDPLWTLGPHDLATLHAIDPSAVVELQARGGEDGVALELTLQSGLLARLYLCTTAPEPKRTTVVRGTAGLLALDELDCDVGARDSGGADPLRRELDHFVDCVHHRRQPTTSFTEARSVVTILERASASLAQPSSQQASSQQAAR